MLRAILFDFNGVLVDDEPLHYELFAQVLGEEGIVLVEAEYRARYLGLDDRGCFTAKLAAAGRTPDGGLVARLIARKSQYYQERIRRQGYPFFPGALELVREAAAADLRLGLVSGALRDEVDGALAQGGIADLIPVRVTAEDVGESKPSPEGYRLALDLLNTRPPLPARLLHPHEVMALEDSPAGIDAARATGLRTVGVAHTYGLEELATADAVVPRLAGLGLAALRASLPG